MTGSVLRSAVRGRRHSRPHAEFPDSYCDEFRPPYLDARILRIAIVGRWMEVCIGDAGFGVSVESEFERRVRAQGRRFLVVNRVSIIVEPPDVEASRCVEALSHLDSDRARVESIIELPGFRERLRPLNDFGETT